MFGSNVLEVAIGLVFVYMLLSLLCSTINEHVIAPLFNLRAKTLEDGIKNMLNDPQNEAWIVELYNNPLIKGLAKKTASGRVRKPSYIPSDTFALALTNIIQMYKKNAGMMNNTMPASLAILIKNANNDVDKECAIIEKWFNDTMDRASGWYKRKVQLIILLLGLVITVGLNVDTIAIITTLSNEMVTRATIVSAAQGAASSQSSANLQTLQQDITQIQPVIGWSARALPTNVQEWALKVAGLLATTFALSLGASFWFDVLNKFMAFRSSGPPPQSNTNASGTTSLNVSNNETTGILPSPITRVVITPDPDTSIQPASTTGSMHPPGNL